MMITNLLAQRISNPALSDAIRDLEGAEFFNLFLPNMISLFLIIAGLVAFFFFIYGGIQWISSAGDKEKLNQASKVFTSALIGLILVFALWAILRLLERLFGIDLIIVNLGPLMLE